MSIRVLFFSIICLLSFEQKIFAQIKLDGQFKNWTAQNTNINGQQVCYATQNRQAAVKNIAPQVDVLIVVGSSNSSNSVRLVDVALEAGVKKSFRVDSRDELKKEWFDGAKSVGLTSGASVPEELVDGVLAWLSENGYGDVEEVETIEEHITFSLPVEIRKDLKAAGKG